MLSTIYLRQKALNSIGNLVDGQYEFDFIQRYKVRCGHQFYEVQWRKSTSLMSNDEHSVSAVGSSLRFEHIDTDEVLISLDELDLPQLHVDGGNCFISTDENMELVQNAFPADVDRFLQQKEVKESKRRKSRYSDGTCETSNFTGAQMAITDYYRSSKELSEDKSSQDFGIASEICSIRGKSKVSSKSLPKSVRRRLLFD